MQPIAKTNICNVFQPGKGNTHLCVSEALRYKITRISGWSTEEFACSTTPQLGFYAGSSEVQAEQQASGHYYGGTMISKIEMPFEVWS